MANKIKSKQEESKVKKTKKVLVEKQIEEVEKDIIVQQEKDTTISCPACGRIYSSFAVVCKCGEIFIK